LVAHVVDAVALPWREEFDAVVSNAVLHWIKRAAEMIAGVHRSLRPGGRFVAECGGFGCIYNIRRALVEALDKRGIDGELRVPWYFPTPGDYATRLERAGFRVDSIALSGRDRSEYLQEVRSVLEPQLVNDAGVWIADYVRLRFAATRTTGG
jgi:SAM-dependent methyltransferase